MPEQRTLSITAPSNVLIKILLTVYFCREQMKKTFRYIFPPLLSGTALVFCFPYYKLGLLGFIALVPFLVSLCGRSSRGAFMSGFLMGLPYFFGTNYWLYHSISQYGGVNIVISYLLVFLLSMYLSLYTGIFASLYVSRIKHTSLPAVLIAPFLWVVLEYIRSIALTGFPYSLIGYTQHEFLKFIQIADITGVFGVSFLVVAVNGAIADFFILKKRVSDKPLFDMNPTINGYLFITIIVIANLFYGSHRLNDKTTSSSFTAAIVQPNIEQDIKWDRRYQDTVLDTLESLTLKSLESGADIIIWPETALPFYYGHDRQNTDRFRAFVNSISTPVLTGAVTVHEDEDNVISLRNSSIFTNKKGKETFRYDKVHLVPFGEYIPLKGLLGFIIENKLVEGIGDFRAGTSYRNAKWDRRKFASIICYEIAFPELVRNFFKKNGDFLVTMTNDAWFGRTTGPYHHFAMSVFRAVENRKPVIRAANTGISGVIDSSGLVQASTEIFTRAVVIENVKTDNRRSIYSRFGDLFIYLCSIITIVLVAYTRRN